MTLTLRTQLSAMMFLQYFIWGAWWVTLGAYMAHIGLGDIIGRTYATQGVAAIIATLFVGMVADRYFSAQRILGVLHLAGAALLFFLSTVTADKTLFYTVVLAYMITFMPTLPLSNAIAFNAMTDTERQFPAIRVFGTVGWIVAGLALSFVVAGWVLGAGADVTIEQTAWPIRTAAVAAAIMGGYAFFLPHTPPRAKGAEQLGVWSLLGLDIFKDVRSRSFWAFMACSLLICIPLAFYYGYTNAFLVDQGAPNAVALQSLGQVSEILFLLALPFLIARLGFKWVLLIGMGAWALRYGLFAYGYNEAGLILPFVLIGILLPGICYDFFFVAGQIYVDKRMPPETRARAQSFLALVTLGVGTLIGGELSNMVVNANTSGEGIDWMWVWTVPAILSAFVALGFAATFARNSKNTPSMSLS